MGNYVIIGNGPAAVGAVEGIRQIDANGKITLISKEKYHTYSRPLISYLLQGKTDLNKMKYRPEGFYQNNNVEFVNAEAQRIDSRRKTVYTTEGGFSYGKLLIATGGKPFVPDIEGLDGVKDKFTFMALDDALHLEEKLAPNIRVLIMGGGLIGLKCAEAVVKSVQSVTVIDIARYVMPSVLDGDCAERVKSVLERNGVSFILGEGVKKFEGNKAVTQNGNVVEFDILVIAVGVRPNTDIFNGVGTVDKGIAVDSHCRTSAENIYAAGDCALSFDIAAKENRVLALLPNAYMQGFCGGANMAGGNLPYNNAFALNSIGFFGYHVITAGCMAGESYINNDGENYKRLFYDGGVLKGFIMGGGIQKAGIYASLIREQTPLGSVDFELLKVNPTLAALGLSKVKSCLGEEV